MDRARDWATRIHHEAQLHEANSFLTLTYDPAHLPIDQSVSVRTLQLFMKRLRKAVGKVRFFGCGEYGEQHWRPHYHVIIFGHDFPDKKLWRRAPSGHYLYRSASLEKVWTLGNCEIGNVTHQSAGYVARYVIKKVTGDAADQHYTRFNEITCDLTRLKPEFICMSSNPGIGRGWYDKYADDAFPSDFVVIEGKKHPVPRYYKKQLGDRDALAVTAERKARARIGAEHSTDSRLLVRQESATHRANQLKRELEEDIP